MPKHCRLESWNSQPRSIDAEHLLIVVFTPPVSFPSRCTVNGDFSNKPSGARIDQLLLNEWRTTGVVGQTDSSGSPFIFRGFYGDYNAQVTVNGQTYQVPFTVFKEENGNAVYLTVPVSGGGRRKLLSAAERGQRNLRRSALTSPERKLPSSYLTALVPGDELRDWDEPSVKNPVRHSVRDSEDPRWEDPPARPARSILSRQQLDAAVAAHEPDGYAPVEEVRTAQRLDTARANHRTLLESQAGELEARHVSIPSGVSRQDYDAASFKNRELLQVNDDLVNDPVNDPCLDSTDELLGSAALDMASTGPGFRELLELREDPVIDPGLELTDGGNGVSRSLLKLGPMHAYLGLGKGFDYVRLELEGDSTRPNDSVKAPEGGENGPQRRLLEVEEAEADKVSVFSNSVLVSVLSGLLFIFDRTSFLLHLLGRLAERLIVGTTMGFERVCCRTFKAPQDTPQRISDCKFCFFFLVQPLSGLRLVGSHSKHLILSRTIRRIWLCRLPRSS